MSRRSIGAVLLALALICAAQAISLAWNYSQVATLLPPPATRATTRLEPTLKLAREASCPESVVSVLEESARGDEALHELNRGTAIHLAGMLRGGAVLAGALALALGALGVISLRSTSMQRIPVPSPYGSRPRPDA